MPLNTLAWAPLPLEFSVNPQSASGVSFCSSLLVFVWPGWKFLEGCPAIQGGRGSPHPGKLERRNLDFSLGSSFLNSPEQGFISVQLSTRAGSPDGVGCAFQEQKKKKKPALLPPPGKTGLHWDGTVPSTHHPEMGLAGKGAGEEEGRTV